mgnify:CR=1 FL=1
MGYMSKIFNKVFRSSVLNEGSKKTTAYYNSKKTYLIQEYGLTNREIEVMELITDEKNNEEIAKQLFISKHTVESHRKNIFKKTGVKSIVGIVKIMLK